MRLKKIDSRFLLKTFQWKAFPMQPWRIERNYSTGISSLNFNLLIEPVKRTGNRLLHKCRGTRRLLSLLWVTDSCSRTGEATNCPFDNENTSYRQTERRRQRRIWRRQPAKSVNESIDEFTGTCWEPSSSNRWIHQIGLASSRSFPVAPIERDRSFDLLDRLAAQCH